jgi:regulator of RNase E activity RraA
LAHSNGERPSGHLIDELRRMGCALVCDSLFALGFRNQYVRGIAPVVSGRFAGPAVTVRYIPWREDLPKVLGFKPDERAELPDFKSVEVAEKGDVIVCDCGGVSEGAAFGDVMALRCRTKGIAAIVVDGAVRDIPGLRPLGVPVYARGIHCYPGPGFIHPVDRNVPVSLGGVAVLPGDIVIGDDDGVAIVPSQALEEVIVAGKEKEEMETFVRKMLEEGATLPEYYPPREKTKQAMRAAQSKMQSTSS